MFVCLWVCNAFSRTFLIVGRSSKKKNPNFFFGHPTKKIQKNFLGRENFSDQLGEKKIFFRPNFFFGPRKNFLDFVIFFFWSSKNIFGSQKKISFGGRLSNKAWGIVWALNSFCPLHRTALKMCLRLLMRA